MRARSVFGFLWLPLDAILALAYLGLILHLVRGRGAARVPDRANERERAGRRIDGHRGRNDAANDEARFGPRGIRSVK